MRDYLKIFFKIEASYDLYISLDEFRERFKLLIYSDSEVSVFDFKSFLKGKIDKNNIEILGSKLDPVNSYFIKIDGEIISNPGSSFKIFLRYKAPILLEVITKSMFFFIGFLIFFDRSGAEKAIFGILVLIFLQFSYVYSIKSGKKDFEDYFFSNFKNNELRKNQ